MLRNMVLFSSRKRHKTGDFQALQKKAPKTNRHTLRAANAPVSLSLVVVLLLLLLQVASVAFSCHRSLYLFLLLFHAYVRLVLCPTYAQLAVVADVVLGLWWVSSVGF